MKQVQGEIDAKLRELARKQGSSDPDRLAAVITIELAQAGEFSLELSYLVMGASWRPQYDVRVQKTAEQKEGEVELTYVGVVQQSTGERWENVGLSLSTARPSLAAVLPELEPWYLNIYTPPPPPMPMLAQASPAATVISAYSRAQASSQAVRSAPMPLDETVYA